MPVNAINQRAAPANQPETSANACQNGGASCGITNKKALKTYIIEASDLPPEALTSCCCHIPSRQVRLINQCVRQFKQTGNTADTLFQDFVHSTSGQKLHRKSAREHFALLEASIRYAGVDITAQSKSSGNTPMISAAKNGHWDVVETLLDASPKGSVAAQNKKGEDVLTLLLTKKTQERIGMEAYERLLHKILINGHQKVSPDKVPDSFSAYAFITIANRCHHQTLKNATHLLPDDGSHPMNNRAVVEQIFRNAANSDTELSGTITYLLSLKHTRGIRFDPNAPSHDGFTPLMMACSRGKTKTVHALLCDTYVLRNIDCTNSKKVDPWTAYTYAHYHGYNALCTILFQHGARQARARVTLAEENEAEWQQISRGIGSALEATIGALSTGSGSGYRDDD